MNRWTLVAVLWVVACLNYVDRQVIFSLFPLLEKDLGLQAVQLGLLSSVFLWVYGVLCPFAGYWADRAGKSRILLIGLIIWSAVTLLTGLTRNYPQLLAARAFMGFSEAFYLPAALALINVVHGDSTRSLATGLHQSGLYTGLVLGGWLGGALGQAYGWRMPFLLLGAIGLCYSLFLAIYLRSAEPAQPKATTPFSQILPTLLRTEGYIPIALVFGMRGLVDWLVYTWLPVFIYERFRMSLGGAGFSATFFVQIASFAGVVLGGWIADRTRRRLRVQAWGLFLAAPFLVILASTTREWILYAALLSMGLGKGIYDANAMPSLTGIIPENMRASAFGWMNALSCVVGGISAALAGWAKQSVGLEIAFWAAGAVSLLCGFILFQAERNSPAAKGFDSVGAYPT